MFIEYGVDKHGELVYIGQVSRGATSLHCPYCGGVLLARKGHIKVHHFAHAEDTCRQAQRDDDAIALPAYDNFNLHLPPKALFALFKFPNLNYRSEYEALEAHGLIRLNRYNRRAPGGDYELTHKGKIPRGELSLNLFNNFQEPLLHQRHQELEGLVEALRHKADLEAEYVRLSAEFRSLHEAQIDMFAHYAFADQHNLSNRDQWQADWQAARDKRLAVERSLKEVQSKLRSLQGDLPTALADLRLYRAQYRRILGCGLYFLQVDSQDQPDAGPLYKIGVTTRDIAERVAEVESDLRPLLGKVNIQVLGFWPARGNVELYFKHRYARHNVKIGELTEYYRFQDIKPVLLDLRRMKAKTLSPLEQALLAGELSDVENALRLADAEQRRRAAIRVGMERAAKQGKAIGRPPGITPLDRFLAKPKSLAVKAALDQGLSVREAARAVGVSATTVQKVKDALLASNGKRTQTLDDEKGHDRFRIIG